MLPEPSPMPCEGSLLVLVQAYPTPPWQANAMPTAARGAAANGGAERTAANCEGTSRGRDRSSLGGTWGQTAGLHRGGRLRATKGQPAHSQGPVHACARLVVNITVAEPGSTFQLRSPAQSWRGPLPAAQQTKDGNNRVRAGLVGDGEKSWAQSPGVPPIKTQLLLLGATSVPLLVAR
ncbi:hypothetical protein ABPG75_010077 [Micractinium tetrahymenae]